MWSLLRGGLTAASPNQKRLLLVLLALLVVLLFRNLVLQPRWTQEARLEQEIRTGQDQLISLVKIPSSTELKKQQQALLQHHAQLQLQWPDVWNEARVQGEVESAVRQSGMTLVRMTRESTDSSDLLAPLSLRLELMGAFMQLQRLFAALDAHPIPHRIVNFSIHNPALFETNPQLEVMLQLEFLRLPAFPNELL